VGSALAPEVGALLALPVVVVPAVLTGTAVSPGLVHTALLGLGMFCLLAWWQALLLTVGRLGFDFGCLLAALRATGTHPRHALVRH
jgi:hypothetical protein